ncbi:hypothetical cytosolic protein [Syntrophus aciditrophicus SB]|uniref:Hypothetical cytosolic protein n=1 Tax=Syntrophus aciditrophicus (strain SB) TaxID=56780 RepID=Q2LTQ0_SYNAS|nr:hypothetical cytosolic protein [Syntrophus aciditrophicus SB]
MNPDESGISSRIVPADQNLFPPISRKPAAKASTVNIELRCLKGAHNRRVPFFSFYPPMADVI